MYRLNYGNGQVSNEVSTLAEIRHLYVSDVRNSQRFGQSSAFTFIQRYEGDGEWSVVRAPRVESCASLVTERYNWQNVTTGRHKT